MLFGPNFSFVPSALFSAPRRSHSRRSEPGTSSAAACRPTSPPGFAGPPTGTDRTRSAPSAPTKSGPADPPRITAPAGLRNLAPRTFGKILSRPGRRWKPGVPRAAPVYAAGDWTRERTRGLQDCRASGRRILLAGPGTPPMPCRGLPVPAIIEFNLRALRTISLSHEFPLRLRSDRVSRVRRSFPGKGCRRG
jgi:hypothetical protein